MSKAGSRGRFITVEGLEGAGKSTCIKAIERLLRESGLRVRVTREPGGTPLGEAVREILLNPRFKGMNSSSETLLMFAARAEHLSEVIQPALTAGEWVVCDRFTDATYAYQGGGRQLGEDRIAVLENWTQGAFRPDVTILLDLPVEIGLSRAAKRGSPDRFEQERETFFERARAVYHSRAAREAGRFRVIDASRPVEEVIASIANSLRDVMEESSG